MGGVAPSSWVRLRDKGPPARRRAYVEGRQLVDLLGFSQPYQTAHQFARDTLRRAILSGALAGGTRLVQADIAAQLKVSTTPVREALRDLASEGLIVFDPHRGAIVHELDVGELIEIYEIRRALEPLVIRKAVQRISDEQLRTAETVQEQMDAETDPGAWAGLNQRFHSLLEQAADSPRLQSIVTSLQDTSAVYVAHSLKIEPHRMTSGNHEHHQLLAAARHRDPDEAAALLVQHLDATLDSALESGGRGDGDRDAGTRRSIRR